MPEVVNSGDVGIESMWCGIACAPACVAACLAKCAADGPLPFGDVIGAMVKATVGAAIAVGFYKLFS